MVEIYLTVHGDQIRFVSVPLRDIRRLAIRPFKWLLFAMFCICGAKGQLYVTSDSDGPLVDYDAGITSLTDDDIWLGVSFFYTQDEIGSTTPISRHIHLHGPLLFKRINVIYWGHATPLKFQKGRHGTRWGVLHRHRRSRMSGSASGA